MNVDLERFDLDRDKVTWLALAGGAAMLAGLVARKGLEFGWKGLRGEEPPINPVHYDVTWRDAIAWSAVTGLAYGVAHLLARRGMAAVWRHWQHRNPPGQ